MFENHRHKMCKFFSVIAAINNRRGLGYNGKIPWNLPPDRKFFQDKTSTPPIPGMRNAVIMGRKTWESLPHKLSERVNIVISSQQIDAADKVFISLEPALEYAFHAGDIGEIFVIGGVKLYAESLSHPWCRNVYLTRVDTDEECDVFFPEIPEEYVLRFSSIRMVYGMIVYRFVQYVKNLPVPTGEEAYLTLVRKILHSGSPSIDRTQVGTLSVFGEKLSFDLKKGFPLLTTKKVYWKGVVEELLWFLKGSTDSNLLSQKGVKIWDKNGSREFLDNLGFFHRNDGDLGPVYGFQWRHFGAEYLTKDTDYTGKGVDQIAECIRLIKEEPSSRRILLSAWNVADLKKMALPPCHVLCQFYVRQGKLSASLYQRSCDIGLGVPFNIASYALLIHMMAAITGTTPERFEYFLGDTHIYNTHLEAMRQQLSRDIRPFPELRVKKVPEKIEDFTLEDLELVNYNPHPVIKMEMAV